MTENHKFQKIIKSLVKKQIIKNDNNVCFFVTEILGGGDDSMTPQFKGELMGI